jgi:hypothetical protein
MVLTSEKSKNYFLFGCIPVRLFLVYIAAKIPTKYLNYFGIFTSALAIGFLYLYFTNGRKNAFEAGGKTWWANIRLLHGLLYLVASIYAFNGYKYVWIPLFLDVILGMTVFLLHHNKGLNF